MIDYYEQQKLYELSKLGIENRRGIRQEKARQPKTSIKYERNGEVLKAKLANIWKVAYKPEPGEWLDEITDYLERCSIRGMRLYEVGVGYVAIETKYCFKGFIGVGKYLTPNEAVEWLMADDWMNRELAELTIFGDQKPENNDPYSQSFRERLAKELEAKANAPKQLPKVTLDNSQWLVNHINDRLDKYRRKKTREILAWQGVDSVSHVSKLRAYAKRFGLGCHYYATDSWDLGCTIDKPKIKEVGLRTSFLRDIPE